MKEMYYVVYEVLGLIRRSGPYCEHEASYHLDDIRGYEGISNARIEKEALTKHPR